MNPLRLSVVLCTYNGSRYLRDQLRSLSHQIRLPDEVVIFDDASTDETPRLLEEFAAHAPFPVRLHSNAENVGYRCNFARGIQAASGDIILLCDQDDVWRPEKIARFEAIFRMDPGLGLAFSDADLVNERLGSAGCTLWDSSVRFTPEMREMVRDGKAFDVLLRTNVVTGATMAFRSEYRPLLVPVDTEAVHDAWIALIISAVATVRAMPEPLILYRQHNENQIGSYRMGQLGRIRRAQGLGRRALVDQRNLLTRVRDRLVAAEEVPTARVRALDETIAHLGRRLELPPRRFRRIPGVVAELVRGRYHRRSGGVSSALRDLIL